MAARGTRNMDSGEESMEDKSLVLRLQQKAKRVNRNALIMGAILTLLALLI